MSVYGFKTMPCSNCGAIAKVVRGDYPFKESALRNVVLLGIGLVKCDKCGNIDPIIPRVSVLMRTLALAVISQPYRLRGDQVCFLRKFLGKSGKEFCELLGINKATLSKWENGEDPVGASSDRLIRLVALGLGEGLHEPIKPLLDRFAEIKNISRRPKIEIDTSNMSYQYA